MLSGRVPPVVRALADGLSDVLGARLVGVYLGGSASLGDFVAASSDYDVLVVTDGALTSADLDALDALHRRVMAAYPDATRLEGDYAPRHLLASHGTMAPVPGFWDGVFQPDIQDIMLSADNIANIREHGIVVYGPPAATVLATVSPDEVRAAVLEMLHEGPGDAATEQQAAAEILNLVRSLAALESGRPTTKSDGVAWALAHLDARWQGVVRRSDAVRRGTEVAACDTQLRTALPQLDAALRGLYASADLSATPPVTPDSEA